MTRFTLLLTTVILSLQLQAQPSVVKNLSGGWQFTQTGLNEWLPATVPGTVHTDLIANKKIADPYYRMVERDVQWIDKVGWTYKTTFDTDPQWLKSDRVELVFDGLDTYATVFLNGKEILNADNMFLAWRVEIRNLLKDKNNELIVLFASPIVEGLKKQAEYGLRLPAINDQSVTGQAGPNQVSIFTRKAGYHYGWDWGPRLVPSGIWRAVRIEAWSSARISDVFISATSLSAKSARLKADITVIAGRSGKGNLIIQAGTGTWLAMDADLTAGENHLTREFDVKNPKLWWPKGYGDQSLYNLSCKLTVNNIITSDYSFRTGIRTIRLVQDADPDSRGKSFYFEVNGIPLFAKGANYIPSDVFVPRLTAEDYQKVIGSAVFANMNMLRVWGGGIYENDIFYDLCDESGILLWHDFMFACSMYPGTPDFLKSVAEEARQNITRLRNHPAMALWCGNNEMEAAWGPYQETCGWGWKQLYTKAQQAMIWQAYDTLFHQILPSTVKALAPSTPYWHSSPSAGMGQLATNETRTGDNHYWGVWHQKHPFEDFNKYISRFMSEYGFQSFPEYDAVKKYTLPEDENIESTVMSSHQRSGIGNLRIREYMTKDYIVPGRFDDFLYVSHILQAEGIKAAIEAHRKNKPYCMGTLYWQLNDCWPVASWSSTDFYRNYKALHYFVKKAYEPIVVQSSGKGESIEFRVISDDRNPQKLNLKIRSLTLAGQLLYEVSKPVKVEPAGNLLVSLIPVSMLIGNQSSDDVVIESVLSSNNQVVASNLHYLVKPKFLKLAKPAIQSTIIETPTDWVITVTADKLVKNLMVTWNGRAGIFSDNYFDVLPGQPATLKLAKSWSAGNPEKELKLKSLVDTY